MKHFLSRWWPAVAMAVIVGLFAITLFYQDVQTRNQACDAVQLSNGALLEGLDSLADVSPDIQDEVDLLRLRLEEANTECRGAI